jgi:hypothetical protein
MAMAVVVLGACHEVIDPPLQAEAFHVVPPPVYARWWAMTEACAGVTRPMEGVSWYLVGAPVVVNGRAVRGYWSAGSNRIVLGVEAQFDGRAVRHEMLHALARRIGHSRELFLRRCGGVVSCGEECIADASAPRGPDPAAVVVTPESLEVSVEISPRDPTGPARDGFVTLTTMVRNAHAYPVTVDLPAPGSGFFNEILGSGENRLTRFFILDPEVRSFAPGEVKRHVVDFPIADDGFGEGVAPGTYTFRGGFGRKYADIAVGLLPF